MLSRFWPFDLRRSSIDNEELLTSVFESSSNPLAIYDQDLRLIKINRAFSELFQIPAKNLIGKICHKAIFHTETRCEGCRVGEIFTGLESITWEEGRTLQDGKIHFFQVFASPITNRKGITTLAFQQRQDVTEQRQRAIQLSSLESQYKTIIQMARVGVLVLDHDGRIHYANDCLLNMLGYRMDEISGRSPFDFLSGTAEEMETRRTVRSLCDLHETVFKKKDGNRFFARISFSPLKGNSPQTNFIGIVTDIGHLKSLEKNYQFTKAVSDKIINNISDSLIVIEPSTYRIVQANNNFLASVGLEFSGVIQKKCYEILHGWGNPCESYGMYCPMRETAQTMRPCTVERNITSHTGKKRRIKITTYPLQEKQGHAPMILRVGQDITQLHKIEQQLASKNDQVVELTSRLETFLDITTRVEHLNLTSSFFIEIEKNCQKVFPGSDLFFFLLNPEKTGFIDLSQLHPRSSNLLLRLTRQTEQPDLLEAFAGYLNSLELTSITRIGGNPLPQSFRAIAKAYASWFGFPLFHGDKCIGYLLLGSNPDRIYSNEDIRFLYALFRRLTGSMHQWACRKSEIDRSRRNIGTRTNFDEIIGKSQAMQQVYDRIEQVAESDATVLICGENGTGKELVAKAIHHLSKRRGGPFIIANCSAFVSSLLESELFGHEKGAFTGASSRKRGRIELADGGTLFLDEIGSISPEIQLLLLRFLQDHTFERVGGEQTIQADVRILAATNRDLEKEIVAGRMRSDFFYRINVVTIQLPPLRERREDIPLLIDTFFEKFRSEEGKKIARITPEAVQMLTNYDWPGNIRQLENALHHAVIMCKGEVIGIEDLPSPIGSETDFSNEDSLLENERRLILKVLSRCNWNKHEAARRLGISRSTLYSKICRHGMQENEEMYDNRTIRVDFRTP